MNAAIEQARAWRKEPDKLNPSGLHRLAKADAEALMAGLAEVAAEAPEGHLRLLHTHLTVTELGATIYRHAMYEAGAMIDVSTGKPFEVCPYCGHQATS